MSVLGIILLVFFIIAAILLILLVLAQNEEGDSLGGIFAGGSGSAFGSRSGNVLTRATTVLGALFLIISLGLALLNRSPTGSGVEAEARRLAPEANSEWFLDDDPPPAELPAQELQSEADLPAGEAAGAEVSN
ncbi:MAG: preprotein translocase subunit SecG [Treponema sp.]|jgi:preprotein translocase subunit SecG|nr:preprotein translocase subunit SecG [Treponema sp.]